MNQISISGGELSLNTANNPYNRFSIWTFFFSHLHKIPKVCCQIWKCQKWLFDIFIFIDYDRIFQIYLVYYFNWKFLIKMYLIMIGRPSDTVDILIGWCVFNVQWQILHASSEKERIDNKKNVGRSRYRGRLGWKSGKFGLTLENEGILETERNFSKNNHVPH